MWKPEVVYSLYERGLAKQIMRGSVPKHVGIILDGNRRWARELGISTATGHRKGAHHVLEVLQWCRDMNITIVTLWMLSTDNFSRDDEELHELFDIIRQLVEDLAQSRMWRLHVLGDLSLLPDEISQKISRAVESTADVDGMTVNVAIGYGGRQEITQAVRDYALEMAQQGRTLEDVANSVSISDITDHMYTKGQPDPDLIIRTSGEQRMSGFMLWQTVHTELYFCDTYWPDFRRTDFLRALRNYQQRDRRMGK